MRLKWDMIRASGMPTKWMPCMVLTAKVLQAAQRTHRAKAGMASLEEERAASRLQAAERSRQARHSMRESLGVCSAAVQQARDKLQYMTRHMSRSERTAAASASTMAIALADADLEIASARRAAERMAENARASRAVLSLICPFCASRRRRRARDTHKFHTHSRTECHCQSQTLKLYGSYRLVLETRSSRVPHKRYIHTSLEINANKGHQ